MNIILHPGLRPGGIAYENLPVDHMNIPVAGLGGVTSGGSSWCSGLIRTAFVQEALSWAGSNPPTERYKDAVLPRDTKAFRDQTGIAFGLGGFSSCGLFVRSTLDRAGLKDHRFTSPYQTRISFAISDILNLARENNALIPYSVNGPQPEPGDILYLDGSPVGGFEHVGILTARKGDVWYTIDGGQPGVEERVRRMTANGTFANDGRALTAFVQLSGLPLPCPTGLVALRASLVLAGIVAGVLATREFMKKKRR